MCEGDVGMIRDVVCNRVVLMEGEGGALCLGFSEKAFKDSPEGDVIHLCWIPRKDLEESAGTGTCKPEHGLSFQPDEAATLAVQLVRTAAFQEAYTGFDLFSRKERGED